MASSENDTEKIKERIKLLRIELAHALGSYVRDATVCLREFPNACVDDISFDALSVIIEDTDIGPVWCDFNMNISVPDFATSD